jgi:RNA polymerase sigma-70 factor (ECF subfamily)
MADPLRDPEPLIRRVYAYVAYRIGDGPDAEDVTSEVFERALRYRDSFDPRKGKPIAWLIGIARHSIDGQRAEPTVPLEEAPEPAAPDDLEETLILNASLTEAVACLNERDRELIALRYGADLSARQIGRIYDITPNAAQVALHRAVERLREALDRA